MRTKHAVLIFMGFTLLSCAPKTEEAFRTTASAQSGSLAPSYWTGGKAQFPLQLNISSDFNSNEVSAIGSSAQSWSSSVNNQVTFFNTSNSTTEKSSSLNSYYDSVMGVYKLRSWPSELPATALAVTQIFGTRRNIGSSSEYIEIQHADILVNYENFSFVTDDSYGYDLQTVLVHEMGHFLGLYHDNSSPYDTVMYPTISRYIVNQEPLNDDISKIASKYGLTNSGVTPQKAMRGLASKTDEESGEEESLGESEEVVIHFEMNAKGEEYFYMAKNGKDESPYLELQRMRQENKEKYRIPNSTDNHEHHNKTFTIENPELIIESPRGEKNEETKKGTL